MIQIRGIASRPDGTARINDVQVIGYDDKFFDMGLGPWDVEERAEELNESDSVEPPPPYPPLTSPNGVAINEQVARDLGLKVGDEFVLRMEKPEALPIDAPLADPSTAVVAMRVKVDAIVNRKHLGNFSLAANQVPPRNVFIPRFLPREATGPFVFLQRYPGSGRDSDSGIAILLEWSGRSFQPHAASSHVYPGKMAMAGPVVLLQPIPC